MSLKENNNMGGLSPGASLGTVPVFGFSGGLGDAWAVPTFFTASYHMDIVFLLLLGTRNTSGKWVRAGSVTFYARKCSALLLSTPFLCSETVKSFPTWKFLCVFGFFFVVVVTCLFF